MPAMQMAQAYNIRRGKDNPPDSYENHLFFKQLAYPESINEVKYPPIGCKAVELVSRDPYAPQWLDQILPLQEILRRSPVALDPPKKLALISPDLILFAPVINGDWVDAPISAFRTPQRRKGDAIELFDFETDKKVMTVRLLEAKNGYMTRGQYQILKMEAEVSG